MALLDVADYSVGFRTDRGLARVVNNVSFTLDAGSTLAIVGESGSGKSVLNRSLMGLMGGSHHVESGSVLLSGTQLVGRDRRDFWGKRIGMIFQDPMTSLNPVMKIGRQVAEPIRRHLGFDRTQARARTIELLDKVGISEPGRRLRQYPHELSGGMRQRVMIAIALAGQPELLIADEPTTALDVTVQKFILDLLQDLQNDLGMSIILITHDLGVARGRADEILVMYGGRVMEVAPSEQLFTKMTHPYTQALFEAIPRLDQPKHSPLLTIPGRPPDPVAPPPGCGFAPRCRYAQPDCTKETPPLQTWSAHHYACFYPVGTERAARALAANTEQGHTSTGRSLRRPSPFGHGENTGTG